MSAGALRKWFFGSVCEYKHQVFAFVDVCFDAYLVDIRIYLYWRFDKGAGNNSGDHFTCDLNSSLGRLIFEKNLFDRHMDFVKVGFNYIVMGFYLIERLIIC